MHCGNQEWAFKKTGGRTVIKENRTEKSKPMKQLWGTLFRVHLFLRKKIYVKQLGECTQRLCAPKGINTEENNALYKQNAKYMGAEIHIKCHFQVSFTFQLSTPRSKQATR